MIIIWATEGAREDLTDGTGTPDPNPEQLSKLAFVMKLTNLTFSKVVIWGSSWGRGFRFHWLRPGSEGLTTMHICMYIYVYIYIYI